MRAALAFALAAALVGCGDDDGGGGGGGGAKPPPPAARPDPKNKLTGRQHIEDMVECTPPEKSSGPACEPLEAAAGSAAAHKKMLADCAPGLYCLPVGHAFTCEKCPERDAIRHEFSDRDFVTDQARDPFYNFVIAPIGVGDNTNKPKPEPHQSCRRSDQFVASNYSYQDLKLIGIVSERTMRKVMMLDTAGVGHIIKRGDCVGKEKAVVKDIGAGYITFIVEEDPDTKRPSQETSVQLHPNTQATDTPPPEIAPDTSAPVVAPPTGPRTGLGQSNTPPQAPPQRTPPAP